MSRFKGAKAASYSLILVSALYAVTAACGVDSVSNCSLDVISGLPIRGNWTLQSINGDPLPAPDPTDPSRNITAGSLDFLVLQKYGGCDNIKELFGNVMGSVTYTQAGTSKSRSASGTFKTYETPSPKEVTLSAKDGSVAGTYNPGTMTFANISDARIVLANKGTATLVFRK